MWGKYYWPLFLIITSGLFLGPELLALATNSGNTLSEYSWNELGVRGFAHVHTMAWWFSLIAWLMFVVVITVHIWWKRFI